METTAKKNWLKILSIILGVVFLLSGFGKLNGVDAFESLIESYGFPQLAFMAPAIIIFEILLGILLVLCFRLKLLGLVSAITLLVFTIFYSYAFIVHGITDCGCFGSNPVLQSSPAMSYIRNAIMIGVSIILLIYGDNNKKHLSKYVLCLISLLLVVCAFVTGKSFRTPSMFAKPHPMFMKPLSETRIPEYVELSSDSTYVIYVFSYDCTSCWNNMANFMNYDKDSIADRSIGFCVGGKGKKTFMNYFKPEFTIYEIDESFSDNVKIVPTFLYIQDGIVHDIIQGQVINSRLFRDNYINNNN